MLKLPLYATYNLQPNLFLETLDNALTSPASGTAPLERMHVAVVLMQSATVRAFQMTSRTAIEGIRVEASPSAPRGKHDRPKVRVGAAGDVVERPC